MKLKVITLNIIFVLMSINPAIAGGRHGHHHGHHGHYDSHYSYDSHYDNHGYNIAYGLGGLIVGGIIGATLTSSYNNEPRNYGYRTSNYVNQYPINNTSRPSYMLQPNGGCYLINNVSNGNLVLSPASSGNCQ